MLFKILVKNVLQLVWESNRIREVPDYGLSISETINPTKKSVMNKIFIII